MECVLALLGGVVLFLFGMVLLGENLQQLAGGRTERALRRATDSRWRGAALGFGVTAVIQSSSAATVLAVSLADAGILTLSQAVPLVIGSNVGTTATAWLLCLHSELPGASLVTVLPALAGLLIYLLVPRRRAWGGMLLGLFLLLTGMGQMSQAAAPLADTAMVGQLLAAADHPLLGVAMGAAATGILQSSSAAIGLVQAFSATGSVTWGAGVPLILGGNIGTCVTVLLASVGGGANAKRAALAHLQFNLLGTAALLPLWLLTGQGIASAPISAVGIAAVHTGFNLLSAALLLPLSDHLTGFVFMPFHKKNRVGAKGR